MKAFKIVIWVVISALLIGVLIYALNTQDGGFNFLSFGSSALSGHYKNSSEYKIGSSTVSADSISSVEINWIAGTLNVIKSTESSIKFDCPDDKALEDDYKLRYLVKNGKLTIQYTKPFNVFQQLFSKSVEKTLNIYIPANVTEITVNTVSTETSISNVNPNMLDIENVSGDLSLTNIGNSNAKLKSIDIDNVSGIITLTNIYTNSLDAETVSGNINAENITAKTLDIDNVSGKVAFGGSFDRVDADTVSGNISIKSKTMLSDLSTDGVSAVIDITIPENDGFALDLDKVSADFECDFETKKTGDLYIYKNGTADFKMDTVSGDINIYRGTSE